MDKIDQVITKIGFKEFDKVPTLQLVCQKAFMNLIKPSQLMAAISVFVVLLSFLNIGSYLLTGVVGFVYPAYISFKALETSDQKDDRRCLIYWTVYAFMQLIDPVLSLVLSFVPGFYFFKVILIIQLSFYVWMFLPNTKGSLVLYDNVLRPLLITYQDTIDSFAQQGQQKFTEAYENLVKR